MIESNATTSPSPQQSKHHFPIFDALRCFAFLKVFIQHLPITAFPLFNRLKDGGIIGVQFFFVLSGFLITYIIIADKINTGTFQLKNFFIRRVLRIWPLFYLCLLVAYTIPAVLAALHLQKAETGYQPIWWISVLFMENYRMIFRHAAPNVPELAVTWSLCIEEHFYIIWGLLLWLLPVKAVPKLAVCCIAAAFAARIVFYHFGLEPTDVITNIDLFAFGALPAYLFVTNRTQIEEYIAKIPMINCRIAGVGVLLLTFVAAQIKNVVANFIFFPTMFGVLFSGILFVAVFSKRPLLHSALLTKLGTYTYGLYIWHVLAIVILARVFGMIHLSIDTPINAMMFAAAALCLTIMMSVCSYNIYEKPFLRLKRFFY
jgi:peptidoglycan/LPS O-acetylase OafA/YrhL